MSAPDPISSVACVVVTYNGAAWLAQCISSLLSSTIPCKVIVVDNDSHDETVTIARSFPAVELIQTGGNLGFGRANNMGIARALAQGCARVFILNQDAHIESTALEILCTASQSHPEAGILCPMQLDDSGTAADPTFLCHYLAPFAAPLLNDALLSRQLLPTYVVEAAPAAAWLFTRQFLETVGGFDPLFFMYCEDDDVCSRAGHHGFQIAIVPSARFYHCRGFHGQVVQETRSRRLRRRTSRLRSAMVRDIKHPSGHFGKNTWQSLVWHSLQGLTALAAHLDWIEAAATLTATVRVLSEVPSIYRHRQICRERGAHWLARANAASTNKAGS